MSIYKQIKAYDDTFFNKNVTLNEIGGETKIEGDLTCKKSVYFGESSSNNFFWLDTSGTIINRGKNDFHGKVDISNNNKEYSIQVENTKSVFYTPTIFTDTVKYLSGENKFTISGGDASVTTTMPVDISNSLVVDRNITADGDVGVSGNLNISGDLTIGGRTTLKNNLTVEGTLITKNKEEVFVGDKHMTLNANATENDNVGVVSVYEVKHNFTNDASFSNGYPVTVYKQDLNISGIRINVYQETLGTPVFNTWDVKNSIVKVTGADGLDGFYLYDYTPSPPSSLYLYLKNKVDGIDYSDDRIPFLKDIDQVIVDEGLSTNGKRYDGVKIQVVAVNHILVRNVTEGDGNGKMYVCNGSTTEDFYNTTSGVWEYKPLLSSSSSSYEEIGGLEEYTLRKQVTSCTTNVTKLNLSQYDNKGTSYKIVNNTDASSISTFNTGNIVIYAMDSWNYGLLEMKPAVGKKVRDSLYPESCIFVIYPGTTEEVVFYKKYGFTQSALGDATLSITGSWTTNSNTASYYQAKKSNGKYDYIMQWATAYSGGQTTWKWYLMKDTDVSGIPYVPQTSNYIGRVFGDESNASLIHLYNIGTLGSRSTENISIFSVEAGVLNVNGGPNNGGYRILRRAQSYDYGNIYRDDGVVFKKIAGVTWSPTASSGAGNFIRDTNAVFYYGERSDGKYDYIAQGSGTGGSGKWYLIPGGYGPSGTISDPSSVWPGLTYDARDNTYELYGNRSAGSTLNTSNTNNVLLIEKTVRLGDGRDSDGNLDNVTNDRNENYFYQIDSTNTTNAVYSYSPPQNILSDGNSLYFYRTDPINGHTHYFLWNDEKLVWQLYQGDSSGNISPYGSMVCYNIDSEMNQITTVADDSTSSTNVKKWDDNSTLFSITSSQKTRINLIPTIRKINSGVVIGGDEKSGTFSTPYLSVHPGTGGTIDGLPSYELQPGQHINVTKYDSGKWAIM